MYFFNLSLSLTSDEKCKKDQIKKKNSANWKFDSHKSILMNEAYWKGTNCSMYIINI